jgi:hypothetical protein
VGRPSSRVSTPPLGKCTRDTLAGVGLGHDQVAVVVVVELPGPVVQAGATVVVAVVCEGRRRRQAQDDEPGVTAAALQRLIGSPRGGSWLS